MAAAASVVLVVLAAFISFGESRGWNTPTWRQIYAFFGVGTTVHVPEESIGAAVRIHFLDVGQASATLVEYEGHFALIDAGEAETQGDVMDYLRAAGVQKLDYLIATHPHSDHIGGMAAVARAFAVEQALVPDMAEAEFSPSDQFEELMQVLNERAGSVHTMQQGDTYPLGGAQLCVLQTGTGGENANNLSPILQFDSPDLRFLCTGDAEEEVEQAALERGVRLRSDLFAAGHHGSYTSNSEDFLSAVRPRVVVVSCGEENTYGHPHQAALRSFASVGARVFRTDECGTVVAYIDEDGVMQITVEDRGEEEQFAA